MLKNAPINSRWKKVSQKKKIFLILVLNTIFNGLLLMFRLYKTGSLLSIPHWHDLQMFDSPWMFMFLPWNLFLGWIPFLIAYHLEWIRRSILGNVITWPALLMWLLFLPNAPYLITDLIHLKYRPPLPVWYDMLMLYCFAWTGLMLGFFSLLYTRDFWARHISPNTVGLFVFSSLALCSFGIYIGRFQRWNSWDLITNPLGLVYDIFSILTHPMENIRYFGITIVIFCLLSLVYLMFKTLIKHHE